MSLAEATICFYKNNFIFNFASSFDVTVLVVLVGKTKEIPTEI